MKIHVVYMHVCVHMHMCVCMYVHVHVMLHAKGRTHLFRTISMGTPGYKKKQVQNMTYLCRLI